MGGLAGQIGAIGWRRLAGGALLLACLAWLVPSYLVPSRSAAAIVRRGNVTRWYRAIGLLDADRKATIATPSSSQIRDIAVAEGDTVRRADIVVRLETLDLQSRAEADAVDAQGMSFAIGEAKANLAALREREREAHLRLDRLRKLIDQGFVSRASLTEAEAAAGVASNEVARADAELAHAGRTLSATLLRARAAQQQLGLLSLRAPISGVVVRQLRRNGEIATVGSSILEIADPESLSAVLRFNAAILPSIRRGLPIRISTDDGATDHPASIGEIGRRVDPDTDEVEVKARLAAPPAGWVLGQRIIGRMRIVDLRGVLVVPRDYLVRTATGVGVWVAQGGRARWRTVLIGRTGDAVTQVRDGLLQGEVVLDPRGQFSWRRVDADAGP